LAIRAKMADMELGSKTDKGKSLVPMDETHGPEDDNLPAVVKTSGDVAYVTTPLQTATGWLAIITSTIAWILAVYWANGGKGAAQLLGPASVKGDYVLAWHVILMMTGFNFCTIYSVVAFRLLSFGHFGNKIVHATFHFLSIWCFSFGLGAVVAWKNQTVGQSSPTGYSANLYSIHSFIGIATLIMFVMNYLGGIGILGLPYASEQVRALYVKYHRLFGRMFLIASTTAIISGIMDETGRLDCEPVVTHRNTDPASTYDHVYLGCKLANGAGILVLIASLCAFFTISNV